MPPHRQNRSGCGSLLVRLLCLVAAPRPGTDVRLAQIAASRCWPVTTGMTSVPSRFGVRSWPAPASLYAEFLPANQNPADLRPNRFGRGAAIEGGPFRCIHTASGGTVDHMHTGLGVGPISSARVLSSSRPSPCHGRLQPRRAQYRQGR